MNRLIHAWPECSANLFHVHSRPALVERYNARCITPGNATALNRFLHRPVRLFLLNRR